MATTTRKPAAKRKTAAKPRKAATKPAPAKKPVARGKPKTPAAAKPKPARAKPAASTPVVTARQAVGIAAAATGAIAAVGAAVALWRATRADQPDYRVVEQDGDFEIREYPAMVTASTEVRGPRIAALDRGFQTLADYIFAKSRPGEKISMTAPVLSDGADTSGWRTRFIMPPGKARGDLPGPPPGVELSSEPPRRIAAVRFSGRANDASLAEKEGALRSWLQLRALPNEARAEHAFYNSPMMPGPLRRNEILVTLSSG